MFSYLDLLNIRYSTYKKIIILVSIFILFTGIILNKEICNVYNTYGYVKNGYVYVDIVIEPDIISNINYIRVEDSTNTEIISIGEISVDTTSLINYQEVKLKTDINTYNNQVVSVSIYYNKEKVWKKIKNIFE